MTISVRWAKKTPRGCISRQEKVIVEVTAETGKTHNINKPIPGESFRNAASFVYLGTAIIFGTCKPG
jgi:hypothetical protein